MGKPFGSAAEFKQLATPSGNPPAGAQLLYFKSDGKLYTKDSSGVETLLTGGAGVTDHGALTGLGDDDHTQYLNDARYNARYYITAINMADAPSTYPLGVTHFSASTAPNGGADYPAGALSSVITFSYDTASQRQVQWNIPKDPSASANAMWVRASTSTTAWGSWSKVVLDGGTFEQVMTFSTFTYFNQNIALQGNGGTLTINPSVGNGAIEIGRQGAAVTPFIDFHSGATTTDYDSRIIASGGTGATAGGTLDFRAANLTWGNDPLIRRADLRSAVYGNTGYTQKPFYRACRTTDVAIANTTNTAFGFNTSDYNYQFGVGGGIATVNVAGLYRVTLHVVWRGNATGWRHAVIQLNGSSKARTVAAPGANGDGFSTEVTKTIQCAVGDQIGPSVYQNSGGSLNVMGTANDWEQTYMEVELIQPL